MVVHHVYQANSVTKQALKNRVGTVQGVGTVYVERGLINQLKWVSLVTVILQGEWDASVPIQLQEESASQGSTVLMVLVSQHRV